MPKNFDPKNSPRQPGNKNDDSLRMSQLFPISAGEKLGLFEKGYLIPGVITVLFVVALFASVGNPGYFNFLLGLYLAGAGYYFIYRLSGKSKPWYVPVASALATILILISPLLGLFIHVFRERLPGGIEQTDFVTALIGNFFGAGLMEELLKALPIFAALGLGRLLQSPEREKIGVWEPLDGILLGAASAVGFTLLETLGLYVPGIIQKGGELVGLQLLIARIIGEVAGHMAYSGYFGYFIGLSVLKPSKSWQILGIGYLTSASLHAFWNASAGFLGDLVTAVAGVLAYAFLIAAILKARQLSPNRSENFATRFYK